MTSTDWALVAVVAVLFLLSIFLAVAETSLTRMSPPKAQALAETAGRRGETVLRLVEHQEWLNPLLLVVLASQSIQSLILGFLAPGGVGLVVVGVLNITVFFVIAEVAPKTWAIQHTDRAALLVARPVAALVAFPPLRLVSRGLIGLTNVILPGKGLKEGPFVSEEEFLAVADMAVAEEVIEAHERDLIGSLLEFGDTIVREVMVPRPDMVTVGADFRVSDVVEVMILNGLSRAPVTGVNIDDVVGVVYLKDLVSRERDGHGDEPVGEVARPARFVPETKKVAELLREMRAERVHLAVVVDEHGGTAGLVTLEDIIEELVGEITDEYDVVGPELAWDADGSAVVPGVTAVDEVNDRLGLAVPEDEDYDSVGGFLLHELGHVPVAGEGVDVDGHRLVVERMDGNRIERVRIEPHHVEGTGTEAPTPPAT
jgi:CBS domain containing-hemolysin-like protein